MCSQKISTRMLIQYWKQPKCLWTEELIKQMVAYAYNQYHSANYLYTGHKDESQKHFIEWKRPIILVWFNLYIIQNKAQLFCGDRNQNTCCLEMDVQGRLTAKRHNENFEGAERVLYLNCGDGYRVLYNC